jgi:dTDP-4-dehydrorhamnose reductase
MHIIVTGANGQVGRELRDLSCIVKNVDFTFLSKEDLPIENFELVRTFFSIRKPDVVINCAAYTAVDTAEQAKDLAFLINGEADSFIFQPTTCLPELPLRLTGSLISPAR